MKNRIENEEHPGKEEIQRRINIIFTNAMDIYDLLSDGMTVEIKIPPPKTEIVVPNRPSVIRTLIISKPAQFVRIHPDE